MKRSIAWRTVAGETAPVSASDLQRGDRDEETVHLEEVAQAVAAIGAPEAVGAEHAVVTRHEGPDLVGVRLHPIGRGDHGTRAFAELLLDEALALRLLGVQQVPALGVEAVAAQLVEAGRAPDVGVHAELVAQQIRGGDHLAQDRAAAEQLDARRARRLPRRAGGRDRAGCRRASPGRIGGCA